MRSVLPFGLALVLFLGGLLGGGVLDGAADAHAATPRVLLVGDSWAQFFWLNRTLRDVFAANGRPDLIEVGGPTTVAGTTAEDWARPEALATITAELDAHPTVDTVQLTIGGNDLLAGAPRGFFVDMTPAQLDALSDRIVGDTTTVIDHVLARGPEMAVVLSLYDYPNFVDTLLFPDCAETWNDLGRPTPRQINEALVVVQQALTALADSRPRVALVDHRGLMQEAFGFPDGGIPPGAIAPPGDLDRPSPVEAMLLQLDCIHLRPSGYAVVGENLWEGYYRQRFDETMPPPPAECVADATTFCLRDGRFEVTTRWSDFEGQSGEGDVALLGGQRMESFDSAMFTFFDPANWEQQVKVLDGCGVNGHYWVFSAATTNVGYDLRVTDTTTGAEARYTNPLGRAAPAITDTTAFPCD